MGAHGIALGLCFVVSSARADGGAGAETLFVEGRAALEAGRYDEACAKLEESQRLDPAPGTLLNLADCEEKRAHLAAAWGHVRHALDLLPPNDDRRAYAASREAALERRLPKLAVRLAEGAERSADVRVSRDGTELPPASNGVLFPVDPGKHDVRLVRGSREHSVSVDIAEGESRVVVLDPLMLSATGSDAGGRRRAILGPFGLAAGGGTLVALTLGATTGLLAANRNATMNDHCTSDRICDAVGVEAGDHGRTYATISTVSFIAAGALAAATVFLFLKGY